MGSIKLQVKKLSITLIVSKISYTTQQNNSSCYVQAPTWNKNIGSSVQTAENPES